MIHVLFLPYHVTSLQQRNDPIQVQPTSSDQMEEKPLFAEQFNKQLEAQCHHMLYTNIYVLLGSNLMWTDDPCFILAV